MRRADWSASSGMCRVEGVATHRHGNDVLKLGVFAFSVKLSELGVSDPRRRHVFVIAFTDHSSPRGHVG
jgi:hypothetical protein